MTKPPNQTNRLNGGKSDTTGKSDKSDICGHDNARTPSVRGPGIVGCALGGGLACFRREHPGYVACQLRGLALECRECLAVNRATP